MINCWRCLCTAVNVAEHTNSTSSPTAVPDDVATPSTAVSADVNDAVASSDRCEADTVSRTTAQDMTSIASETNDCLSAAKTALSSAGSVKRRRGRPLIHAKHLAERRNQKLTDVCTIVHFIFLKSYINC